MKINDYSTALMPQEVIDLFDDIKTILNYGKYQIPSVTSVPGWTGRLGEQAYVVASNTWALYTCTSDQSTRWVPVSLFVP